MIETRNEMYIASPADRIFSYAAATEKWPLYLPHYRRVNVLENDGRERLVEMSAWRDVIPVRWTARQWNDAATPSIRFHHVAGWTKGMDVEWRFEPRGDGTMVSIIHALDFQFPVARDFFGKYVVAGFFVHDIASKTLRRMKELAESA